jgi:hypothetical protein
LDGELGDAEDYFEDDGWAAEVAVCFGPFEDGEEGVVVLCDAGCEPLGGEGRAEDVISVAGFVSM